MTTQAIGNAGFLRTSGNQIVDATGDSVKLSAVSWFGMETSRFLPDGLHVRSYKSMLEQIKDLGFNTIRLPISNELFDQKSAPLYFDPNRNPEFVGLKPPQILDKLIEYAGHVGLRIILDHHRSSASEHGGVQENGLWYTRDYPEARWISDWQMLASRYAGNATVIGAELHNEPFAATWGGGGQKDWAAAAERAGNAIHAVNPNWLIFVQGVRDHGGEYYWDGGNLMGVRDRPVELAIPNRVVYTTHEYPNSVYPQPWFQTPNYPNNLPEVFRKAWGYIFEDNIAPVFVGELGSRLQGDQPKDLMWFEKIRSYLAGDFDVDGVNDLGSGDQGMSWGWWSWNPNSSDTGGILKDDWTSIHYDKVYKLSPIMGESLEMVVSHYSGTPGPDSLVGSVNADEIIGYAGNDTLDGGAGNDHLIGGAGRDILVGGTGLDTADYSRDAVAGGQQSVIVNLSDTPMTVSGVTVGAGQVKDGFGTLDTLTSIERVRGTDGPDTFFGSHRGDSFLGEGGDDHLWGGQGDDTLIGGEGSDTAVFSGLRRSYDVRTLGALTQGASSTLSVESIADGVDRLESIETLRFADGSLVFAVSDPFAVAYRMYDTAFDRLPDSLGLNYWSARIQAGTPLDVMATGFSDSPEFQRTYGALSNRGFVEQLYRNVLDRAGEAEGITYWTRLLNEGSSTRGQILVGFSESPEHIAKLRPQVEVGLWDQNEAAVSVARLYHAALDRAPDAGGLTYWTQRVEGGQPLSAVADGFAFSAEFQQTYGALSQEGYVRQLYRNVLDREADAGGLSGWLAELTSGRMDRGDVLLGFSESLEFQIKIQPLMDGGIMIL